MLKLPKEYRSNNYTSTLIEVVEDIYIYSRIADREHWMTADDERRIIPHYEIIIPQKTRERFSVKPQHEWEMPSPSQWGKQGYTCATLDRARTKVKELIHG